MKPHLGIGSKEVSTRCDNSPLAHGDFIYRHSLVPVLVKASGSILKDSQGHSYLDAEAANGTANLGFDNNILNKALHKISQISAAPSFFETEIREKFAKRLNKRIEGATGCRGRLAFELGGAQGIELAIKVIKSNSKKTQLVVFEGGYHGRSIFTSQLSASHRYRSIIGDWRIPIIRLPYPDYSQSNLSHKDWLAASLEQLRRLTTTEIAGMISNNGKQDIAALIIEPVLNAGGIVKPDPKYMEEIVRIFRKLGAIIVVDEIFCGFYRTGPMFGFQNYNFIPDMIVMSKAITNGITPLSCVWARDPYLTPKHFPPGTHSSTFANNVLALAVADTVLDYYDKWHDREEKIRKIERQLQNTIQKVVKSSRLAKSGYALGALGRILLKKNIAGQIDDMAMSIGYKNPVKGIHGLILASTGLSPNVLAINPPLNISEEHLLVLDKLLLRTFEEADGLL